MNIMNVHADDLEIVDQDKFEYWYFYSFPCQDISAAGLQKGLKTSQKDGGTRSGLLWEVERMLVELHDQGKHMDCLFLENVPQLIQTKFVKDFQKWEKRLTELGYKNYIEVLNTKEYGIPQNRQRVFMVSVYGDHFYEFPRKTELKYFLKDLLLFLPMIFRSK